MSYKKILAIANKFNRKLIASEENPELQVQKEILIKFYQNLNDKLRNLVNEISGEAHTLKERNFDRTMLKAFLKIAHDLHIMREDLNANFHLSQQGFQGNLFRLNPYETANKFVNYVTSRSHKSILDNLEFFIQNHLEKTKIDTRVGKLLGHPTINSFKKMRELAGQLKRFMESNPLLSIPEPPPLELESEPMTEKNPVIPVIPDPPVSNPSGEQRTGVEPWKHRL